MWSKYPKLRRSPSSPKESTQSASSPSKEESPSGSYYSDSRSVLSVVKCMACGAEAAFPACWSKQQREQEAAAHPYPVCRACRERIKVSSVLDTAPTLQVPLEK